jgi:tetratricopeptide (TPR) repeat protein
MDSRKYLLIVVVTLVCCVAKAQGTRNFEQVDTTISNFYKAGDWKQVIIMGQKAIDNGIDFPALRQELGYAYFISGNYARALESYDKILGNDSRNPIAGYYAYLSGKYLNHDLQASFYASK